MFDKLDGSLEIIEKAVDIGEQDDNIATGSQQLCDLQSWDEVSGVRASGSGGSWQRKTRLSA